MLYKVRIQLKGYAEYEIDAPSEEEAEAVAADVALVDDPDLASNLEIVSVDARRTYDTRAEDVR